jgi:hypothetical protein
MQWEEMISEGAKNERRERRGGMLDEGRWRLGKCLTGLSIILHDSTGIHNLERVAFELCVLGDLVADLGERGVRRREREA